MYDCEVPWEVQEASRRPLDTGVSECHVSCAKSLGGVGQRQGPKATSWPSPRYSTWPPLESGNASSPPTSLRPRSPLMGSASWWILVRAPLASPRTWRGGGLEMCTCGEGAPLRGRGLVVFRAVESGGVSVLQAVQACPCLRPLHLLLSLLRAVFPPDIHTAHSLTSFQDLCTCLPSREAPLVHVIPVISFHCHLPHEALFFFIVWDIIFYIPARLFSEKSA